MLASTFPGILTNPISRMLHLSDKGDASKGLQLTELLLGILFLLPIILGVTYLFINTHLTVALMLEFVLLGSLLILGAKLFDVILSHD